MTNKTILYFLLSLCLFCSCSTASRKLDTAEQLLIEYPNNAYTILSNVDTLSMSEQQKSRRALLLAYYATVHVTDIDLSDADIERIMNSFNGDCSSYEVKSLMIKSEMAKREREPVIRLELLKDAEFLASQLDDMTDLGFIYLYLSNVYTNGFNGTVSKHYADKSLKIFNRLGYMKQSIDARMAIVGAYALKRDYATMLDSMLAMKDDVTAYSTDSYKIFFFDQLARVMDENGQSKEAIELWHKIYDGEDISSNTLAHWASAYIRTNQLDSAEYLINKAISLPHNHSDEYLCRNVQYDILERLGRKADLPMIDSLRETAARIDYEGRKIEDSSLALNMKYDSATRSAWHEKQKAQYRALAISAVAVILILLSIFAVLYYRKRNHLLKIENENNLLRIRAIENNLFEKERSRTEVTAKISSLFRSRFATIDQLASAYFECKETGQEQKRIYAEARSVIEDFTSSESLSQLEEILNTSNDNLMACFNKDFPSLSSSQRRLALFIFCGLSLQSISIFQGTILRNIYVYKSRLKATIAKSDSPRKEIYMRYFN